MILIFKDIQSLHKISLFLSNHFSCRRHIFGLIPSSSFHYSLSSCIIQDYTDPPSYETHDDTSFSFCHKILISDNLWLSSCGNFLRLHSDIHLSPHCPPMNKNAIGSLKVTVFSTVNFIAFQTSTGTT